MISNSKLSDPRKANILVVDDTPENLQFLSKTLTRHGYKVRSVVNGQMAITVAQAALPDLILLDILMPDMDGYEVCQHLKSHPETQEIPVIFLSALSETTDKVKAFSSGGVDYISKPFQIEEVLARIENQLSLIAAKLEVRQLNSELEQRVHQRTSQLEAANKRLREEILERKRIQKKLLHIAWHDSLTGLPNRALFMNQLEKTIQQAKQNPDFQFAVLFLDCDCFKVVNNSLGHLVGDELLIAVAHRLQSSLKEDYTLARLGGDEFTVLLTDIHNLEEAIEITESLQKQLSFPFYLNQYEVFINASIGIVLGHGKYEKPEHILRDADTAMYQAKKLGKARYQVFDQTMHTHALSRLQLETELRWAIERQELAINYQPIVCLKTGKIQGFEALVRWQHPHQGSIYPSHFIPVAEETGLIVPMGLWVLKAACLQLRHWQNQGFVKNLLTLSVNLSAKQLSQPHLLDKIDQILEETQVDAHHLKLEITESIIMENADKALALLQELKARNVQLSIDDFGTGYSSLSYLQLFPVDTLKIDRAFVSRMADSRDNLKIIKAIISLAHTLGMNAIAEGVETSKQLALLRKLGCEFGQGYLFSHPLDSQLAEQLMDNNPCW